MRKKDAGNTAGTESRKLYFRTALCAASAVLLCACGTGAQNTRNAAGAGTQQSGVLPAGEEQTPSAAGTSEQTGASGSGTAASAGQGKTLADILDAASGSSPYLAFGSGYTEGTWKYTGKSAASESGAEKLYGSGTSAYGPAYRIKKEASGDLFAFDSDTLVSCGGLSRASAFRKACDTFLGYAGSAGGKDWKFAGSYASEDSEGNMQYAALGYGTLGGQKQEFEARCISSGDGTGTFIFAAVPVSPGENIGTD